MQINRHDLLILNARGREAACRHAAQSAQIPQADLANLKDLVNGRNGPALPGIVRRSEAQRLPEQHIAIGFSTPFTDAGMRRRYASMIDQKDIDAIVTPFEVWRRAFPPRTTVLQGLRQIQANCGADGAWGVWGSAALEIFTGLPFTHAGSDLDLIIRGFDNRQRRLLQAADKMGHAQGLRIDFEILLQNGAAINAREYLNETAELLAKAMHNVTLMSRTAVEQLL